MLTYDWFCFLIFFAFCNASCTEIQLNRLSHVLHCYRILYSGRQLMSFTLHRMSCIANKCCTPAPLLLVLA